VADRHSAGVVDRYALTNATYYVETTSGPDSFSVDDSSVQ
jgi:hypothetical protein